MWPFSAYDTGGQSSACAESRGRGASISADAGSCLNAGRTRPSELAAASSSASVTHIASRASAIGALAVDRDAHLAIKSRASGKLFTYTLRVSPCGPSMSMMHSGTSGRVHRVNPTEPDASPGVARSMNGEPPGPVAYPASAYRSCTSSPSCQVIGSGTRCQAPALYSQTSGLASVISRPSGYSFRVVAQELKRTDVIKP